MSRIASTLSQSYLQALLTGERNVARNVIENAGTKDGHSAYELLNGLVWPTMELLQSLYRDDRITISSLNLATRLNRTHHRSALRPASQGSQQRQEGTDLLRRR